MLASTPLSKSRLKSESVYQELCRVIPGGVNSPVRANKGLLDCPMVVEKGAGDLLYDVDENAYIDFCMSWGALIHGHAKPEVIQAAYKYMLKGTTYGATTEIEGLLAKKICMLVPSVEKVRFVSSGTEATMSAIRLARGYTGRSLLIKFSGNYHGHADFLLVKAGSGVIDINNEATSKGIPAEILQSTVVLPFNDVEAFEDFMSANGNRVAAVIVEAVAGNMGTVPGAQTFMNSLRQVTQAKGALLIFDEVMTGFRVAKGGAQSIYNIDPDLSCFSKIIGGGFPAGAFGGKREIMDQLAPLGEVYQAGTLSGNPVAMSAGLTALELLDVEGFYEKLSMKTKFITDPIKAKILEKNLNACVQQVGSMFTLFFGVKEVRSFEEAQKLNSQLFKDYFCYMFDNGVFIPPSPYEAWFISSAHTEENLTKTRDLTLAFLENL